MSIIDRLYYSNLKPNLPNIVMIEPTNACNLKCVMCDYQKQLTGKRAYLSIEKFELIIKQFPNIRELIFCGVGESLLNRDIVSMISIAAKKKVPFINLITNGVLLKEEYFKSLVKAGLTRIHISFHSTDSEISSKINGVAPEIHNHIRDNIVSAVTIRKSHNYKIRIVLNCVINSENYESIFNIIDFCEDNKIDEINFVQLSTIFGKYKDFNIEKDKAIQLIKKIRARVRKSSVTCGFLTGNCVGRCYQLWNFIMVHSDGKISPCNGIMPHEEIGIGNLIQEDISRIWHSDEYVMLRKSVIAKRLKNCEYCEAGYLLAGKNLEWVNNYYLKPIVRNLYSYIRK